jgi:hypothetical protein
MRTEDAKRTIMFFLLLGFILSFSLTLNAKPLNKVKDIKTYVVCHHSSEFSGWPANNGLWHWKGGKEIVVGFTTGSYVVNKGFHNISETRRSRLARSTNGGKTWKSYYPDNYVIEDAEIKPIEEPINFKHPDFALKMCGFGYHAHELKESPAFYFSYDKGKTWKGPFPFSGLSDHYPLLSFKHITMRTDYHVVSNDECVLFGSATKQSWGDKVFAFRTKDGGYSFEFVSWIVPPTDPFRAVMPQTLSIRQNEYISVIRRRAMPNTQTPNMCWIDAYKSVDEAKTWQKIAKVAETGNSDTNGNPPALTQLRDGRLLVVYGNRSLKQLLCKVSADEGVSWSDEIVIRDDFQSKDVNSSDFGYPRVMQRKDGKIVVVYYFADNEHGKEQHIDCSIITLNR